MGKFIFVYLSQNYIHSKNRRGPTLFGFFVPRRIATPSYFQLNPDHIHHQPEDHEHPDDNLDHHACHRAEHRAQPRDCCWVHLFLGKDKLTKHRADQGPQDQAEGDKKDADDTSNQGPRRPPARAAEPTCASSTAEKLKHLRQDQQNTKHDKGPPLHP